MLDALWAILVAGGSGSRLGADVPKQYLNLAGRPLFLHALAAFAGVLPVERIVLVLPPGDEERVRAMLDAEGGLTGPPRFAAGGATRQASVAAGLAAIPAAAGLVAIHDAARPFFDARRLADWARRLAAGGAAGLVPLLPMADTVLALEGERVTGVRDRARLGRAQTPQLFPLALIRAAHAAATDDRAGDDVTLALALGKEVIAVPGDPDNVKITTAADLAAAERRLGGAPRVGFGYDSHRFDTKRPLILGGVDVPSTAGGLAGHSDADVLTHAVIDALLGAAALGDIGRHFPDDDPAHAGADSLGLLARVLDLLAERALAPAGVDATLIAERPRLAPHVDAIRASLAAALGLPEDRVNVKATTNEGLGALGRGEGMAAQAVATLRETA